MKKKRIVIKVGTNVLQSENGKLDYNLIRDLADQISVLFRKNYQIIFVSSGAVGAGEELQSFSHEKNHLLRRQMSASVGQIRLMQIYSDFFLEHQIVIAQVLVTRSNFGERISYLNIGNTLEGLLATKVLPIINENDVVAADELNLQFGDNDQLAVFVSALVGADALFYLTIAPGLLKGTKLVETVSEINEEILSYCDPILSQGGRGGMLNKVKSAGMAMSFGIDTYIVSGKMENVVLRILEGERIGTHFVAQGEKISSYRKWMTVAVMDKGKLVIDKGAEKALYNKKSLLAAGITEVSGDFKIKDLVNIYNHSNIKIGIGRINFSAEELRSQILEYQGSRSNSEKGHRANSRKAVINRDYLVLIDTPLAFEEDL
ncbi:MAG: glutamate 5-kinase [SAR324 cluster bacterium]|nr:glutamate 5-kinase [SAR324 cluster bacterium]